MVMPSRAGMNEFLADDSNVPVLCTRRERDVMPSGCDVQIEFDLLCEPCCCCAERLNRVCVLTGAGDAPGPNSGVARVKAGDGECVYVGEVAEVHVCVCVCVSVCVCGSVEVQVEVAGKISAQKSTTR